MTIAALANCCCNAYLTHFDVPNKVNTQGNVMGQCYCDETNAKTLPQTSKHAEFKDMNRFSK